MKIIDAIYVSGVFKPLGQVSLPENQRVRLTVESANDDSAGPWLNVVIQEKQNVPGRLCGAPVPRCAWSGCRLFEYHAGKFGVQAAKRLHRSIGTSVSDDDRFETAGHTILFSKRHE